MNLDVQRTTATTQHEEDESMASKGVKTPQAGDPTPAQGVVSILANDHGNTTIDHNVVAKIAGLAAREVDGVHSLVPFSTGQRLSSVASAISGSDMKDLGVHVEVGEIEAAVDIRIITEYGQSIPKITQEIQQKIHQRLGEMTGLKVKEVNIEVVDLWFDDGDVAKEAPEPRVR